MLDFILFMSAGLTCVTVTWLFLGKPVPRARDPLVERYTDDVIRHADRGTLTFTTAEEKSAFMLGLATSYSAVKTLSSLQRHDVADAVSTLSRINRAYQARWDGLVETVNTTARHT